jgi:integration host factor subunit alpha
MFWLKPFFWVLISWKPIERFLRESVLLFTENDMTLTKAELVQHIYKNHPTLSKTQATELMEAFLRISKNTLSNGSDLLLSGFGKFNVKDKDSRRGRNPQTGDTLILDARRVITFKPSGILRDKINN